MFGVLRTVLALIVVCAHLWGAMGYSAAYAVFAFYTLSGFLMARILHETYGFSPRGFALYILNRVLRLYPLYWLGCAVALALIAFAGADSGRLFHRNFQIPDDGAQALSHLLNWYVRPDNDSHLVPPSWAIAVEFSFYVLIGLGLGRSRRLAIVWLAASIAYHALALHLGWDRYYSIAAASLPFALGVSLYHWRGELVRLLPPTPLRIGLVAATLAAIVLLTPHVPAIDPKIWPFYGGLAASALLIVLLANADRSLTGATIDRWAGQLSYPIYILHYHVAFAAHLALGTAPRGAEMFATAVPLLLAVAACAVTLQKVTVDRLRDFLRHTAARRPAYGTSSAPWSAWIGHEIYARAAALLTPGSSPARCSPRQASHGSSS